LYENDYSQAEEEFLPFHDIKTAKYAVHYTK